MANIYIRVKAPSHSVSKDYNYEGYHSAVLIAVVEAKRRFVVTDDGTRGSNSDGGARQDLNLVKYWLLNCSTNTHCERQHCSAYVFVVD